jgi:hypothetical protein
MHLRQTKTEQEFLSELQRSHDALFNSNEKSPLYAALCHVLPELKTAYVLGCTPEQAEDIYMVLIDNTKLVKVEIERKSGVCLTVEHLDLRHYERGLSKINQIQLAVAKEMGTNDRKTAAPLNFTCRSGRAERNPTLSIVDRVNAI